MRRRALADFVAVDGLDQGDLRNTTFGLALVGDVAAFDVTFGSGVTMTKEVHLNADRTVQTNYGFEGPAGVGVTFAVDNGLIPNAELVMDTGREALAFWDGDTTSVFHPGVTGRREPTAVASPPAPVGRLRLAQNRPNPCNPSTTIAFDLPARVGAAPYEAAVFDARGRLVKMLARGT